MPERRAKRQLGRYCSQKEKAHSFLLSVRLGGHVQPEYPSGRPENPRAIIPFVNRSLTSGLPIGSPSSTIHVCLMDKALWVSVIIIRRGVARRRSMGAVVALTCERPEDSDRPISQWSQRETADEVMRRGII